MANGRADRRGAPGRVDHRPAAGPGGDCGPNHHSGGVPKCTANGIYRVPAGQALIITGVNFYNAAITAGMEHELDLYAGPASSPCVHLLAAGLAPSSDDHISQNQVFNPGIPVPAGDALGVEATNEVGSVEFYGYLVPKADVAAGAVDRSTRTQVTTRR